MTTCFFNKGKIYADTRVSDCNGSHNNNTSKIRELSHAFEDAELGTISYFCGSGQLLIIENINKMLIGMLKDDPSLAFRTFTDAIYAGLMLTGNASRIMFICVKDDEVRVAVVTKTNRMVVHDQNKVVPIGSGANVLRDYKSLHDDDPMKMMRVATILDPYTNSRWTVLDPIKKVVKHITVKPTKSIIDAINKRRLIDINQSFD